METVEDHRMKERVNIGMKLIIGGAYQGKLAYAKEHYQMPDGWIDGRTCRMEEIRTCEGIYHFHEYVKRMLQNGGSEDGQRVAGSGKVCAQDGLTGTEAGIPNVMTEMEADAFVIGSSSFVTLEQQAEQFAAMLNRENPNILIVSNELGYGIVPMEKDDRMWRETVGRICTCLAARAEEVVRVVCGVGMRLK